MLALVLAPLVALAAPPPRPTCRLPLTTQAAQHAPTTAHKLGDLPDADMDLAVLRNVDGCAMRQVVRFHVSDPTPDGSEAGLHLPGVQGTLVPQGDAFPKAQPVK